MTNKRPRGVLVLGVFSILFGLLGIYVFGSWFLVLPGIMNIVGVIANLVSIICGVFLLSLKEIGRKSTIKYLLGWSIFLFFWSAERHFVGSCRSPLLDCEATYYKPFDLETLIRHLPFLVPFLLINFAIIIYLNEPKIKECFK